jgi:hypothetical protein
MYATNALSSVRGLRPIGTAPSKASVLSFVMDGFRMNKSLAISTGMASPSVQVIIVRSRPCIDTD